MRYALVIGNSEYDDGTLAQLKTPVTDTQALAAALNDPKLGEFDDVSLIVNQTESITRRGISQFFAQKKPDDLVLLYFSCHGILDDRGRLYLAVKDTQHDLLKATGISASFITDEMDSCRSRRQVLIMDCCYGGAFVRGTKGGAEKALTQTTFEGAGYGRVVLTASDSTQFALEGDQVVEQANLSLFTHYLLNGLTTGEADQDQDGQITLDELYDYTYNRVVSTTPRQTPCKWSYNQQGDLYIAKSPLGKVIKPAELPLELKEALQNPYGSVRLGAVEPLRRLLEGSDASFSLAAQMALESLTTDDSRSVSAAATKIMADFAAKQQKSEPLPPTPVVKEIASTAPAAEIEPVVSSEAIPDLAMEQVELAQAEAISTPQTAEAASPIPISPAEVFRPVKEKVVTPDRGVRLRNFWLTWIGGLLAGAVFVIIYINKGGVYSPDLPIVVLLTTSLVAAVTGTIQWLALRRKVSWANWWIPAVILSNIVETWIDFGVNPDKNSTVSWVLFAVWMGIQMAVGAVLALRQILAIPPEDYPEKKALPDEKTSVLRKWGFWLRWLGLAAVPVVAYNLAYQGEYVNNSDYKDFIISMMFLTGAIIGTLQWSMLKDYKKRAWVLIPIHAVALALVGIFTSGDPVVSGLLLLSWFLLNLSLPPRWALGPGLPAGRTVEEPFVKRPMDWRFWLGWAGALLVGVGLGNLSAKVLESIGWDPSPSNYAFFFLYIGGVMGLIQWFTMRKRLPGFLWWIPLNVVLVAWVGYWMSPWQSISSIGPTVLLLYVLLNLASGPLMLMSAGRQTSS